MHRDANNIALFALLLCMVLQRIAIPAAVMGNWAYSSMGELLALLVHTVLQVGSLATPILFALEASENVQGVSGRGSARSYTVE
jgi:hypothetical protein